MSEIRFDHLVGALASSVVQAEDIIRKHQISDVRGFFDEQNRPIVVPITLPQGADGSGEIKSKQLDVPLISLVNVSALSIDELNIQFTTVFGEVAEDSNAEEEEARTSDAKEGPDGGQGATVRLGWHEDYCGYHIHCDQSGGHSGAGAASATITVKVKARETPEGVSRLLERLNRSL